MLFAGEAEAGRSAGVRGKGAGLGGSTISPAELGGDWDTSTGKAVETMGTAGGLEAETRDTGGEMGAAEEACGGLTGAFGEASGLEAGIMGG